MTAHSSHASKSMRRSVCSGGSSGGSIHALNRSTTPVAVQAPPPPPSIKRAALELFVRHEVRPRVELICAGGLEGSRHQQMCLAVAKTLDKWQPIHGAGIVAPFCERICWHSCQGESHIGGVRDCAIRTKNMAPLTQYTPRLRLLRRPTTALSSARARAVPTTRASTFYFANVRPWSPTRSRASTTARARWRRPARRARPIRRRHHRFPLPIAFRRHRGLRLLKSIWNGVLVTKKRIGRPTVSSYRTRSARMSSPTTPPKPRASSTCCASRPRRAKACPTSPPVTSGANTVASTVACIDSSYPRCRPSSTRPTRTAASRPRCPFAHAATRQRHRRECTPHRRPLSTRRSGTPSRAMLKGRHPYWVAASPTPHQRGPRTTVKSQRSPSGSSTGAPSTWHFARVTKWSTVLETTTPRPRARAFARRSTSGFCAPWPSRARGARRRPPTVRRPTRRRARRGRRGIPFPSASTCARTMACSTWTMPVAETVAREASSQRFASIRPTVATADFVSTPTSSSPTTRARAH